MTDKRQVGGAFLPSVGGGVVPAVVMAMGLAGCVTTAPTQQTAVAGAPQEEPLTAYLQMLREHGVDIAIPARGKFILVNIPSYELIALQDGQPVLRSRVIVGQPALHTPEMLSPMVSVRFNPAWTPTPSMIRNEFATYIPPGPNNPLGRVMFELVNDEFIFLHDTNQKRLFSRTQRALSHGCVRVEQARPLAAWALGVSVAEIDRMVARGRTFSVPLPEEIPVFLGYYTRFPDADGRVASHPDIYANSEAEHRAYLARASARRAAIARQAAAARAAATAQPTDATAPASSGSSPPLKPAEREPPPSDTAVPPATPLID
jgi:lipoprotein-anchoring transpeptidase ErfK/SrfK